MKAIFNSRIVNSSDHLFKTSNRSFCYGDGLFETIVTGRERINLIEKHLLRLKRGCQVLDIDFPNDLNSQSLEIMINELKKENRLKGDLRSKLIVWRNTGGMYSPHHSESSFSLETKSTESKIFQKIENVDISLNIHTLYSPISFAKTTSALNYVLAGIEKTNRGLDEIILTDQFGNLSETHSSNLFWVSKGQVYTPELSTGCIEGVMRNTVIELLTKFNIPIKQVITNYHNIYQAKYAFSTNASGIRYFGQVGQSQLKNPEKFLNQVLIQLQQP